jgi:hypothetical protein
MWIHKLQYWIQAPDWRVRCNAADHRMN